MAEHLRVGYSNSNEMKKEKSILVVLGMHRSGTSVATRIFNLLGANPGNDLMLPSSDNPTGFWEPTEIVNVHDELLQQLGYSWDDPRPLPQEWWIRPDMDEFSTRLCQLAEQRYGAVKLPIIKDPRLCSLLPIWLEVFKKLGWKPHYILVGRPPLEVADSLMKRNNITDGQSYLLWLRHVIESEKWSRGSPRTFILYDRLLGDWEAEIKRCRGDLGLQNLRLSEPRRAAINDFIDPNLRHSRATATMINKAPDLSLFLADTFDGFQK